MYMYIYICACIYTYVHIYIHMYMYIYICTVCMHILVSTFVMLCSAGYCYMSYVTDTC